MGYDSYTALVALSSGSVTSVPRRGHRA